MKKTLCLPVLVLSCFSFYVVSAQPTNEAKMRIAVAGMSHGHIAFILKDHMNPKLDLVGVYEPNHELAVRYAKRYHFDSSLIYNDLGNMLDAVKPEAVAAFGSIYDHLSVVEACAPRGVHVMVEKPLATTVEAAEKMARLAQQHHIFLLTDYETSWYPSNAKAMQLIRDSNYVGKINKVVVHDGHEGPKEIGVNKEFFDWLTDPVQNGGGALVDFGCYGANLMTWLMGNEKPVAVSAITQQLKPDIYPKVDDDATIVVKYPSAVCVIQASWNWPFSRKDIEIYGKTGYIINVNDKQMRLRKYGMKQELVTEVTKDQIPVYTDPFDYFYAVVKGKITMPENGLYSLENNVQVVKILSAARESAKTGKTVKL